MSVRVCNDKIEIGGVDISHLVSGYKIVCEVGSVTVVELTLIRPENELKINGRTLAEMFAKDSDR
jgi:hypothetical protein